MAVAYTHYSEYLSLQAKRVPVLKALTLVLRGIRVCSSSKSTVSLTSVPHCTTFAPGLGEASQKLLIGLKDSCGRLGSSSWEGGWQRGSSRYPARRAVGSCDESAGKREKLSWKGESARSFPSVDGNGHYLGSNSIVCDIGCGMWV